MSGCCFGLGGWDAGGDDTLIVSASISVGKDDEKPCDVILVVGRING